MALEIVWRNPVRLPKTDPKLRRIRKDGIGVLYAVTNVALVQWYELVRPEAAGTGPVNAFTHDQAS
jgi:hypothetical protein